MISRAWGSTPITFLNHSKWSTYDEHINKCLVVARQSMMGQSNPHKIGKKKKQKKTLLGTRYYLSTYLNKVAGTTKFRLKKGKRKTRPCMFPPKPCSHVPGSPLPTKLSLLLPSFLFSLHCVLLPSTAATIHGRLLDPALLQKKSHRWCEYWRVDTTAIDEKLPICVKDIFVCVCVCVCVWEREREREREREVCLMLQFERSFCTHACVHWWKKRCGCQPRCGIIHLVVSSILLHSLFSFSCNIAAFLTDSFLQATLFLDQELVFFWGGASGSVIVRRNISTMTEMHWARKSVVQIVDGTVDVFSFAFLVSWCRVGAGGRQWFRLQAA